jgi:hypothetical protein
MPVNSYLGEGAIVPEVTLVGEAVTDEAQLALLDILLDGVEKFLLGDLVVGLVLAVESGVMESRVEWTRWQWRRLTSILALVQRGISTIMFKTVCCSLA